MSTEAADAAAGTVTTHPGKFPGWRVVGASFTVLSITSGLGFYGLAVYLNAFATERGWEVSSVSRATTLCFVVAGSYRPPRSSRGGSR